ncbi:hypothetical protein BN946_scf184785.g45 [Trametes cinnabarina]|uniref:Pyrroline-5-carboxylate reductase n=1 Tax=Pycnoporus cinnabarinus TaxID=5643 RepID=A0A060S5B1_PYCCI|nr:hypothetical protein BN946_scf184785.g45 [Trametes cinnabarina]
MGVAILSGVLASLESKHSINSHPQPKWESHTPGTVTPQTLDDDSLPSRFIACVSREESAKKLGAVFFNAGSLGRSVEIVCANNVQAARESNVVILWQIASTILSEPGMKDALAGKLLISILAGVTIAQLEAMVGPSTRVVRAMPNTPCKIREGMTVVSTLAPSDAHDLEREIILNIFSAIGRCRFLEEKHFDACTALSGSGPAFACIFLEAMADGGVMMGLPRAEALELAAQTLQGAARMTLQAGTHPAQLKDAVTTPGGCTIAGLLAMEDGRVRSTIARAIQVATERASELGQPAKK